ncbi:MAG: restriction endonuclease subunit S [Chloroflexota bacterium]
MKTGPFGTLLKKHEHREEGVPVIGIENIGVMQYVPGGKIHITSEKADQLAKYDVQEGDLVISRSGTVGEVAVIPDGLGEARLSTNVMRITLAPSGMRSMFLAFLFNGSPFVLGQVSDLCKGSTRDFLNQRILKSIIFPLPPLAEQDLIIQKVERRLSVADEIEKELDQALARSERLRQSILKRAFEGRLIGQKSNVIHQEISHGKNQNPPRSKSPG